VAKTKARAKAEPRAARNSLLRQAGLLGGIVGSLYVVVAIATYDSADPSFTHVGAGEVRNEGGPLGAWVADALLQTFGLAAWGNFLLVGLLSWKLAGRSGPAARVVGAWLALLWSFTAIVALVHPVVPDAYPFSGLVGLATVEALSGSLGPAGTWLVAGGTFLGALPFALGFEWSSLAAKSLATAEAALPKVQAAGTGAARSWIRVAGEGAQTLVRELPTDAHEQRTVAEPTQMLTAPHQRDFPETRDGQTIVASPLVPEDDGLPPEPPIHDEAFDDLPPQPTQAVQRELVEVQWDPTDPTELPERAALPDGGGETSPRAVPPPRPKTTTRQGGRRLRGEDLPDELPLDEVPAREGPHDDELDDASDDPAANPPVDFFPDRGAEEALDKGTKPKRKKRSKAGLEITPGQLSSGGNEAQSAFVDPAIQTIYELPHIGLLDTHKLETARIDEKDLERLAHILEEKLKDFGVTGQVVAIRPGPVITIFEYLPGSGVKLSKISGLSDDIAMAMKALRVRIVAPIPGKGVVGIEIPNRTRQTVWFRDLLTSEEFRESSHVLPMTLGKTVEGKPFVADLAGMPHLLVGGTTGSGKSVGVNAMLLSMLYRRTPEELRLILIDPKMLEFELYRDIPHLLHPVITEARLASAALRWACDEMDNRYRLLSRWGTRNLASYNEKVESELEDWTQQKARKYAPADWPADEPPPPPKKLPLIVVVIDELADLMMVAAKDVEESIVRLAQKARACGIHLIVATQRPSVDVITGLIKANMPSRIAFQVRTRIDGRTILDQNGAETLLGRGDQLFLPPGVSALQRLHGPFVSDSEVNKVTDFLRAQGAPVYEADIPSDASGISIDPSEYDPFYDEAVAFVIEQGKASTSMVQRQFKIGYNRAARIVEIMETEGVVGPADGAKPREVLVGRRTG
jgi:DNA segregation ATPase FtsK/SpoIIIE-like protein